MCKGSKQIAKVEMTRRIYRENQLDYPAIQDATNMMRHTMSEY